MKIIYTLPGIQTPHGGYRIVMEHLTRLQQRGHEVALYVEHGPAQCNWYDHNIFITGNWKLIKNYDCLVIGSPHSIRLQDYVTRKQKCFLFMQMVEEKFRPNDGLWHRLCKQFYLSKHPIIHGSKWGEEHCNKLGRTGEMHYIGNGVNFDHFPISKKTKTGKVVLLEGCFNKNPAKDTDQLALKVAKRLKDEDNSIEIIGYGFDPMQKEWDFLFDDYICRPNLVQMNDCYEQASILLKATKFDARALSPMEAMTKGTVTARGIIHGDDDLIHNINCLSCYYHEPALYKITKQLLDDQQLRILLGTNARNYVQDHCNWDKIISELNSILCA